MGSAYQVGARAASNRPFAGACACAAPPAPRSCILIAMRRRVTPIVAALVVLGALAVAPPSQALTVGIADQQAASFLDPLLQVLPIRHARLSVAWDALRYDWQREQIDEWMRTTKAAGLNVVVTFGRSRTRAYSLPPTAVYRANALRFMRRYRSVREYSPWNEPNLATHARNNNPRRIATYYRTLRGLCPRCKVLGADVVDSSTLAIWMREYLAAFAHGRAPRLWGLHNYVDVNSSSRFGTQTMLRLAPGQIWFTETGAIFRRRTTVAVKPGVFDRRSLMRVGAARSVAATKRVFTLARSSPRIARVYVYHWRAGEDTAWDSALLAANGTPRAAYDTFAEQARLSDPSAERRPLGAVAPG
jgi:hypothetical protein